MWNKKVLLIALIFGLSLSVYGCSFWSSTDVSIEPIIMKISIVEKENTAWGCIGEAYKTYFRSEDGKMAYWCGQWGKVGDKVSGYWHTGHLDGLRNGFKRFK